MQKIILIFLLSILTISVTHAARSGNDQLGCIARKIIEDCKDGELLGKCNNDPEGTVVVQLLDKESGMGIQATCSKKIEHDADSIIDQIKKYEGEIYSQARAVIGGPPALVCDMKEGDIFLENQNGQYSWGNSNITCPIEKNYYAETHGNNSPAVAGDNNTVATDSGNSFFEEIISGITVTIIGGLLLIAIIKGIRFLWLEIKSGRKI